MCFVGSRDLGAQRRLRLWAAGTATRSREPHPAPLRQCPAPKPRLPRASPTQPHAAPRGQAPDPMGIWLGVPCLLGGQQSKPTPLLHHPGHTGASSPHPSGRCGSQKGGAEQGPASRRLPALQQARVRSWGELLGPPGSPFSPRGSPSSPWPTFPPQNPPASCSVLHPDGSSADV